jgi:hypothetical protein
MLKQPVILILVVIIVNSLVGGRRQRVSRRFEAGISLEKFCLP